MKRIIFVIAAADLTRANAQAKASFDKRGGERTFTTRLSATGAEPATHFVCSGLLADNDYVGVKTLLATYPGASIVDWQDNAGAAKGKDTLAQLGLQIIRPPIAPAAQEGVK
jgi:hypothetical protein